jgi:hypothetical protein
MHAIAASRLAERSEKTSSPIALVVEEFKERCVGVASHDLVALDKAVEDLLQNEELQRRLAVRDEQRTWGERQHWR